ncbi:DUF1778 domain-containing protein [Providencia sp. PROV024]|nr:DUF1778 domain-containing protein [Providencia sp. PROV024]
MTTTNRKKISNPTGVKIMNTKVMKNRTNKMISKEKIENERITIRMPKENKELLDTALALSGFSSLSSFIAMAAANEAKKLIAENALLKLCQRDAIAFVELLDKPTEMNEKFIRAAKRHKELISNGNSKA